MGGRGGGIEWGRKRERGMEMGREGDGEGDEMVKGWRMNWD